MHALLARKTCNKKREDCPIKGCHSSGLLKLANHLTSVYNIKNKETRLKWLNLAKEVISFYGTSYIAIKFIVLSTVTDYGIYAIV